MQSAAPGACLCCEAEASPPQSVPFDQDCGTHSSQRPPTMPMKLSHSASFLMKHTVPPPRCSWCPARLMSPMHTDLGWPLPPPPRRMAAIVPPSSLRAVASAELASSCGGDGGRKVTAHLLWSCGARGHAISTAPCRVTLGRNTERHGEAVSFLLSQGGVQTSVLQARISADVDLPRSKRGMQNITELAASWGMPPRPW